MRRLNEPVRSEVHLDAHGTPVAVALPRRGHRPARARARDVGTRLEQVECVLDTWHVDDGWWTGQPVRRICHELQLASGTRCIASWDLEAGCWYVQR